MATGAFPGVPRLLPSEPTRWGQSPTVLAGTAAPWHGPAARDLLCSMLSLTLRDYYLRPSPLSLKLPVAFRIGQFLLCNKQVQKSLWPARVRVCRHACRPADRPGLRIGRVSHYSGPGRGRGHVLLTAVAAVRRPGPAGPCRFAALFTSRIPSHALGQVTRPGPPRRGGNVGSSGGDALGGREGTFVPSRRPRFVSRN